MKKKDTLPLHVAFIMDGNRRWAKKHNLPAFAGHREGFKNAKRLLLYGKKLGINYATLYAFSTENRQRKQKEVKDIFYLLEWLAKREIQLLQKEKVRVKFIGSRKDLPEKTQKTIQTIEDATASSHDIFLQIAFNYGSRNEITEAVKSIVRKKKNPKSISEETISQHLFTAEIPDPDFMIRTGGEKRLSNFLLWQLSYTELFFTDVLWPDFNEKELDKALTEFALRKRNYGK